MFTLGVLSGMLLAWAWLVFASPHAQSTHKESTAGMVNVRCVHCGVMSLVPHSEIRTTNYCVRCK
jgi:hypothetical protein